MQIFEVGDIVLLDDTNDVGAVNRRHLAALYCGANSGFEVQIYHICSSCSGSLVVLHCEVSLDLNYLKCIWTLSVASAAHYKFRLEYVW